MNARLKVLVPLLLLLVLPAVVQAKFSYTTTNGTATITGYPFSGPPEVIIPDTINGLPVARIGEWAFSFSSLISITFGTNVTSIGARAFMSCWGLATVTIPNNVTSIGSSAFGFCTSLTEVTIGNGVADISSNAFERCFNLASVRISQSVTNIGSEAFISCTGLKGVYFEGNAPGSSTDLSVFSWDDSCAVYYLAGTTGWEPKYSGRPTAFWVPEVQAGDASFGVRTNQFGFTINWASDRTVVVDACTNLANPTWHPIGTNTLTSGSAYFSDPQWTNFPARFYRLRSP